MANAILLKGGGGGVGSADVTLTPEYMLKGKTSVTADSDDEIVEGTMPDNSGTSKSLNAGESYTIPVGYQDGTSKVTANSLASQTQGTATADEILLNETATVNGVLIKGTMLNNEAVTKELGAGGSYTIPKGYHNGSGKITVQSLATITSAGTVTSNAQILSGYKAYSDGNLYTGSIASLAGGTYTASQTTKTISCAGKYMTSNIIISATNVQSIISFSFASRNYATANFKWQNPAKGPFYGIVVRGKQGSYPTSVSDGTAIYSGYGTNTAANGTSYSGFKSVGTGTWYFSAYSYYILDGVNVYSAAKQTSATFNCYQCSQYWDCSDCDSNCNPKTMVCSNCHDYSYGGCGDAGCPEKYDCGECNERWCSPECSCDSNCGNEYCSKSYPSACNANT